MADSKDMDRDIKNYIYGDRSDTEADEVPGSQDQMLDHRPQKRHYEKEAYTNPFKLKE